jgi:hypothetical protein
MAAMMINTDMISPRNNHHNHNDDLGSLLAASLRNISNSCSSPLHPSKKDRALYDSYLSYLHSEWLYTVSELQLVSDDQQAWTNLKLPARLKIELKTALRSGEFGSADSRDNSPRTTPHSSKHHSMRQERERDEIWIMCFSQTDDSYYYYNAVTYESQWDCPDDSKEYDTYDSNPYWDVQDDGNDLVSAYDYYVHLDVAAIAFLVHFFNYGMVQKVYSFYFPSTPLLHRATTTRMAIGNTTPMSNSCNKQRCEKTTNNNHHHHHRRRRPTTIASPHLIRTAVRP